MMLYAKPCILPRCTLVLIAFVLGIAPLQAQNNRAAGSLSHDRDIAFDVKVQLDWRQGMFSAQTGFTLASAGLQLPAGRLTAEHILEQEWAALIRPYLLSIRVDSQFTLGELLSSGDLPLADLDNVSKNAAKTPTSLSEDMSSVIGRYTVHLRELSAVLSRRARAAALGNEDDFLPRRFPEPPRPLIPAQTADYSGIIILAHRPLPIRGRQSQALIVPSLFPKIWDTNMNLIYDRSMIDAPDDTLMVRYASPESVFRTTPSGLDGELSALVGTRPLRILAREVFGMNPTDPVIDRDDALQILSSPHNRRLLQEGRVVLVLDAAVLEN